MPTLEHHAVDAAAPPGRWIRGRETPVAPGRRATLRAGGRNVSWIIPAAILLAVIVADAVTSDRVHLVTWTVLVPALSAALCGVVTTAVFAALAAAAYPLMDSTWSDPHPRGYGDFLLVVLGGVLAVVAAWLRARAQKRLIRVENAAEATRVAVLRPMPARVGGLEVAGRYLAADRAGRVGGDFFEVIPTPFGPRVLLGDVQGKGPRAVAAAAAMVGTFREAGFHEPSIEVLAERLECRMMRHNRSMAELELDAERFATAVLVGFPGDDGAVDVVNFGHPAPLAVGPDGVRSLPDSSGVPIGLGVLAGTRPVAHRVRLARDETLLLVTDGVTEARNRRGDFLPLPARLSRAAFADTASTAPRAVVDAVEAAVQRHTRRHLTDDTAILAVRRGPEGTWATPACPSWTPGEPGAAAVVRQERGATVGVHADSGR